MQYTATMKIIGVLFATSVVGFICWLETSSRDPAETRTGTLTGTIPVSALPRMDTTEPAASAIGDAINKAVMMGVESAHRVDTALAGEINKLRDRIDELERDKYWPQPRSEMDRRLWDRIDELEKRVKELEAK